MLTGVCRNARLQVWRDTKSSETVVSQSARIAVVAWRAVDQHPIFAFTRRVVTSNCIMTQGRRRAVERDVGKTGAAARTEGLNDTMIVGEADISGQRRVGAAVERDVAVVVRARVVVVARRRVALITDAKVALRRAVAELGVSTSHGLSVVHRKITLLCGKVAVLLMAG